MSVSGIVRSPFPEIEIPDTLLSSFVFQGTAQVADKAAFIDGFSGRSVAHGELFDAAYRAAGGLASLGFGKGDVLAILLPNVPEYPIAFHAAAIAGGIVTTINPTYTVEEVAFQLSDSGAVYLLTATALLETAQAAAATSGVKEILVLGEPGDGAVGFAELLAAARYDADPGVTPGDVVAMPYSSGTTGLPKGVMISHRGFVANHLQRLQAVALESDEVYIAVLPFFHIYGITTLVNGVIQRGVTAVTMPRFDFEEFLRIVQEYRVTFAPLVPPIILGLAKHPLVDQYDLSSLRVIYSGAAPLPQEVAAVCSARIGCPVVEGYGMTETIIAHVNDEEGAREHPGSIGRLLPNTEAQIVEPDTGNVLDPNKDGEIWIRGPQVMIGYLNNPEATSETIDEQGWVHTGDIGHYDEDGYFYVVDRVKELIKVKAYQVAPAELEALLLSHPSVADAAVIGIPDEEAGEIPKAFVVASTATTGDELMAFVADRLAPYKRIRQVEFIEQIPKSPSGKILRRTLRDKEASPT